MAKKATTFRRTSWRVAPPNGGRASVVDCMRGIRGVQARLRPSLYLTTPRSPVSGPRQQPKGFINAGVTNRLFHASQSSVGITERKRASLPPLDGPLSPWRTSMLILLIILLLVFGFGGFRLGPGLGYYGGGGISLLLLILIILLVTKII